MTIDDIHRDFDFLDDWEDKYRYIIELGRTLFSDNDLIRTEAYRVHGCVSRVWVRISVKSGDRMYFSGDSDAHIVRGLMVILFRLYEGQQAKDILKLDALKALERLGLKEHLSPQRSNGLASMIEHIRREARSVLESS